MLAAVCLPEPSLFENVTRHFATDIHKLRNGFLAGNEDENVPDCTITSPRILGTKEFSRKVYDAWLK